MTNRVLVILTIIFIISACKTNKSISTSDQDSKEDIEVVGHLKIRLIDYEIVDTSIVNIEMAEMMIEMMRPIMESELIFNHNKSVELVKTDNESNYVRRILYDRSSKIAFQFLFKDSVYYYSEMNITDMMSEVKTSPEELVELGKMFKLKKYSNSGIEILGFKCDEVKMMQPDDYSKVYSIVYTTDKIPHISEAMGPMSKFLSGAPIKTVMFVNGLKITIGAIEYEENLLMKKYLDFNRESYEKLTIEQFDEMKNY